MNTRQPTIVTPEEMVRLYEIEYRHECLKQMWDAEVNNCPPDTVDKDIDVFIQGEDSHP